MVNMHIYDWACDSYGAISSQISTSINVLQNGVAPIHSAVYLGLDNMVELLINYGAQVNLKMKVREEWDSTGIECYKL